jgi:hypothetical protein
MKRFRPNELMPRLGPKEKEHWAKEVKTRGAS